MSTNKDSSSKAVISAILGNGSVTLAKFVGWAMTASPSMLAEAIHSLADTSNQLLLYVGIRHGRKGPTRDFPLGRGRARYVWNLISAIGIFFVGFGITAYHGVHSLVTKFDSPPAEVGFIGVSILIGAFLIEGYVFLVALKIVNRERGELGFIEYLNVSDDPTTIGVLFEDGIAVLGIVLALGGIHLSQVLQSSIPDAIASIFIAILLGLMAVGLAYTNSRFLIGYASSEANEEEIKRYLESQPLVEKVTLMRTSVLGPGQLSLTLEVEFHGGYLVDKEQLSRDAEKIRSGAYDPLPVLVDTAERTVRIMGNEINALEKRLRAKFPYLTNIEMEVN